jgi:hypothetical protein
MDQPRERDRIQCLECGKWYRVLPPHLRTHDMDGEDYRLKFGVSAGVPLVCEEWSEAVSRRNIERDAGSTLTARGPKPGFKMRESTKANRRAEYERIGALGRKAAHAIDKTEFRRKRLKPYPVTIAQTAERLQCTMSAAYNFLASCAEAGRLRRIGRGVYDEVPSEEER